MHHGWVKLGNVDGTAAFMQSIGLPGFAYIIIAVEILGGAMLILGVLGRVAAVATGIAMLVALALVTVPNKGFVGSELELLLLATSFGIALTGVGRYRLLSVFEHEGERTAYASGDEALA